MNLIRINDIVESFGVSSRTLRYYEEKGLIWSHHPDNKAQRYYDPAALERLRQIIVLRKLQIPIKDMVAIFKCDSLAALIQSFVDKLGALDGEITALSELRRLVDDFLNKMLKSGITKMSAIPLLYEETEKRLAAVESGGSVSFEKRLTTVEPSETSEELPIKEPPASAEPDNPISFEKLSEVSREAAKLHDIRIIRLPATRMLTSRLKTGQIEDLDGDKMQNMFAKYGFTPTPGLRDCFFRFENDAWIMMIKIPESYDNQTPYQDETFPGGLYAITSAYFEDMDERHIMLKDWVTANDEYELDANETGVLQRIEMIEEILPWDIAATQNKYQQDIFVPIRLKFMLGGKQCKK